MIVRSDVPVGVQLAQAVHAAARSAQLASAMPTAPPMIAVALAAALDQLVALERVLIAAGVPHVVVREPDPPWCNAVMAIGVVPTHRARVLRMVAHLSLVRGKDCRE